MCSTPWEIDPDGWVQTPSGWRRKGAADRADLSWREGDQRRQDEPFQSKAVGEDEIAMLFAGGRRLTSEEIYAELGARPPSLRWRSIWKALSRRLGGRLRSVEVLELVEVDHQMTP